MPASRSRGTQQVNHRRQPPPHRQHKRYNKARYNNNNFRRKQRRQEWQETERLPQRLINGRIVDLVQNVRKYVDNLRDHVAEQFRLRPICPPPLGQVMQAGQRFQPLGVGAVNVPHKPPIKWLVPGSDGGVQIGNVKYFVPPGGVIHVGNATYAVVTYEEYMNKHHLLKDVDFSYEIML